MTKQEKIEWFMSVYKSELEADPRPVIKKHGLNTAIFQLANYAKAFGKADLLYAVEQMQGEI